jgi:hypothetical protein
MPREYTDIFDENFISIVVSFRNSLLGAYHATCIVLAPKRRFSLQGASPSEKWWSQGRVARDRICNIDILGNGNGTSTDDKE